MKAGPTLAAIALAVALASSTAGAHPVDEIVEGAYLFLAPGELRLELELTPGTAIVAAMLPAIDPDGNGVATPAEANAWAEAVLSLSTLDLDGVATALTFVSVAMPEPALVALGSPIRIIATVPRPDTAGEHTLTYNNAYAPVPAQRFANIFLQPGGGWTYTVTSQEHGPDGASLIVRYVTARP